MKTLSPSFVGFDTAAVGREAGRPLRRREEYVAHAMAGVVDVLVNTRASSLSVSTVLSRKVTCRWPSAPVHAHSGATGCRRARALRDDLRRAVDIADLAYGRIVGGVGGAERDQKHKDGRKKGPAPKDRPQDRD